MLQYSTTTTGKHLACQNDTDFWADLKPLLSSAVEHYFKIPALLSQPTAITPALCLVQSPLEVKHNIKPGHSAHTQIQLYDITDKNGDSKDIHMPP